MAPHSHKDDAGLIRKKKKADICGLAWGRQLGGSGTSVVHVP